jgi:predicted aspartyl protease
MQIGQARQRRALDFGPAPFYVHAKGKVVETIRVANWGDIEMAAAGARKTAPRSVEVDALVDTGAGLLYLQTSVVKQLGLRQIDTMRSRTMSNLLEERRVCSPVQLSIAGRTGIFRVVEIPDALPNLIGQIPLEELDLVVDLRKRKVVANPEHPDGPLYDEF